MARALEIHIPVSGVISEEGARMAEVRAKEAAVIALQQAGDLTIREAAAELGLSYEFIARSPSAVVGSVCSLCGGGRSSRRSWRAPCSRGLEFV